MLAGRDQTIWACCVCGHPVIGTEAPKACPVCDDRQSGLEIRKKSQIESDHSVKCAAKRHKSSSFDCTLFL